MRCPAKIESTVSTGGINLGYEKVLWYRGGLEAWQLAGLPVQSRLDQADAPLADPRQKMLRCNRTASERQLTGEARKAFMIACLRS